MKLKIRIRLCLYIQRLIVDVFTTGNLLWAGVRCFTTKTEWCSIPRLQAKIRLMEILFSIYIFFLIICSETFGVYYHLLIIESGARTLQNFHVQSGAHYYPMTIRIMTYEKHYLWDELLSKGKLFSFRDCEIHVWLKLDHQGAMHLDHVALTFHWPVLQWGPSGHSWGVHRKQPENICL